MTTQPDTLLLSPALPGAADSGVYMQREGFLPAFSTADGVYGPGGMETLAVTDGFSPLREAVTANEVFGAGTRMLVSVPDGAPRLSETDRQESNELMLDGLVVPIFFLYIAVLFRYRLSIFRLFRSLTIPGQFDQLIEEQSVSFRNFIRSARLTGFLALLAIAFKGCLIWLAADPANPLPEGLNGLILPLLAAALLAILCYKRLATGTISLLSGQKGKVENIRTFNRVFFTAAALVLTPAALLCTLTAPGQTQIFFTVEIIVLIFLVLYYFAKSFSFFVSRKISILQWILYLCAVEIWPVSFFVLFARRGFEW